MSKLSLAIAFWNFSGVFWTENIRCVFRVKTPLSNFSSMVPSVDGSLLLGHDKHYLLAWPNWLTLISNRLKQLRYGKISVINISTLWSSTRENHLPSNKPLKTELFETITPPYIIMWFPCTSSLQTEGPKLLIIATFSISLACVDGKHLMRFRSWEKTPFPDFSGLVWRVVISRAW